jgi:hypothetical protein
MGSLWSADGALDRLGEGGPNPTAGSEPVRAARPRSGGGHYNDSGYLQRGSGKN